MRVFTTHPRSKPSKLGPSLKISKGNRINDKYSRDNLRMMEVRYDVGLKTPWKMDFPVLSLVTIADSTTSNLQELPQLGDPSLWDTASIYPSVRATGIAAFALRIRSLILE
jgi:hypothetical protein